MKRKDLRAKVLFSLKRGGYIGGQHTSYEDACKGFPVHERKIVKKNVDKLIKERFLIPKNAGYGLHVSINPRKLDEIKKIIESLENDLKDS